MKSNILIIANPKAGKSKINKYINIIAQNLENNNYNVKIKLTSIEKNATDLIKEENEFDKIIVCGGDGTLNQVVQGLYDINKNIPIGFIPIGTINDFAKSLNISFDKFDLSKNIEKYDLKKVDSGKFNNHIFDYAAVFGLFSKTSYKVSYKCKNKIGKIAYWIHGIQEIFCNKSYNLKIKLNENEISNEFIFGSISNSKYIGGFKIFDDSQINLNDGIFEVIFVKKPKNLFEKIKIILKVINGKLQDDKIIYFKTSKIYIESEEKFDWSLDGEYGGSLKNISIEVLNKNTEYLVPVKYE